MLDFRFVENAKISEPNIVTIYNTSNEKIKLKWLLNKAPINNNNNNLLKDSKEAKEKTSSSLNINEVFLITPDETSINRNSAVEFKFYFKPNKQEFYYFAILTCSGTIVESSDKKDEKK